MAESFIRRPLTGLLLLAGAAGGPYFIFETDVGSTARTEAGRLLGVTSETQENGASMPGSVTSGPWDLPQVSAASTIDPMSPQANLNQPPVVMLSEVLRFDVTPAWITQRFPRVSTVLADMQLDGLRVPLVTGTTQSDLAGTLTYYFDRYQRLQRVSVHALTGDPTRVIAEMQHSYQLYQEPSLGGGLYLTKWNGKPTSIMHVSPAAIIRADAPYARFQVFVELNQPGLEYGLSPQATDFVATGRAAQRW
ncbi:MAG: hypothetical protein KDB22_15225 [Planctomycetales bacterium]|nr:hypothetical protein [Planctomycetales bacterium]